MDIIWRIDVCPLMSAMQPVAHKKDQVTRTQSKEIANVSRTGIGLWKWL